MKLHILILLAAGSLASAQTPAPSQSQAQREYSAAETRAIKQTVAMYPDAGKAGSALNKALQSAAAALRKKNPAFFQNPNWPVLLATEIAGSMGILPNTQSGSAAATAPSTPIATPAPARQTEIPMVSAKTGISGHRDNTTTTGTTISSQAMHAMSVVVEYRFFHELKAPVEIQCFFIARNEASMARFIYEAVKSNARKVGTLNFTAQPLAGGTKTSTLLPVTGTLSDGTPFTGQAASVTETKGSKAEGWIVRFVSGGEVLTIDSNQPFLSDLARKSPAIFDKATFTSSDSQ